MSYGRHRVRDEDFECFIGVMGEATSHRQVPGSHIVKYRGILPDALLTYWQKEGWCGYANGLFWTVDPDDYKRLLDMWLAGTELSQIDNYHVIARSAFGALYAWGEKYNQKIVVSCPTGSIVALMNKLKVPNKNPDLAIQTFFAMSDKERYDLEDSQGEFLFERALEKLGALDEHEVYGFEPALFVGGTASLDQLVKCNLEIHLTSLRQMRS
nr:GAD-like domain-containing protein [Pseudomonas sp. SWRI179]